MLRFSELELKEKEGGEEEGMTAAAVTMEATGETELADGQQRDGGREEKEGGGWESCQQRGGGRTPSAAAAEAPRGKRISVLQNGVHQHTHFSSCGVGGSDSFEVPL